MIVVDLARPNQAKNNHRIVPKLTDLTQKYRKFDQFAPR